jgi:hypothetical protein
VALERELREETRAREDAQEVLARTKAQLDRREDELQRERQRAADAAAAGARAAKDKQFNVSELDKLVAENTELREELRTVLDDMQVCGGHGGGRKQRRRVLLAVGVVCVVWIRRVPAHGPRPAVCLPT